ncbi:hypothetical protein EST38_g4920 [Candolleomyces aberdarensis]|uniref:Fungal-type protein kinase domain-containing protein n=1 Tax=Candolleomyces aberdarensis TaxID=2316362 RepID=A0A4Q2DLU7_9AGAR|nr:hypothetical protein EST38_g4920 [Candolleomyces aberdarensis]
MRTRSSDKKTRARSLDRTLDEQKRFVNPELGEVICLEDGAFARSLYHHLAPKSAITDFLRKSRSYSLTQRRWKLPRSYNKRLDNDLFTPFLNIFSSILKHFWNESTAQVVREIIDTHNISLPHHEGDSTTHSSRPSFVIRAKGPSFQLSRATAAGNLVDTGFSNVASCIDIQVTDKDMPMSEQLMRAAIYARQIFIQQPNRRFVRLLALCAEHFRLFHFDRSGIQYTPYINFHDDPHTFVRIILGLSSPDESDIGLDSSIQWTIENGRKVGGTLRTCNYDNQEIVYPLTNVEPFFFRGCIRGRATICWSVRDPVNGEELVVKDSWKSGDRLSEHVYLQDAFGTPGVAQMVSCEPERDATKTLRGFSDSPPGFHNRIETRIVMKTYGTSIRNFTSVMQVLGALRDAIAGHMELHKKGTLHRDVSIHNVLFGKPGAEPGCRGVLIDLDMAIHYLTDGSKQPANCRIGTRLYQSIAVLSSGKVRCPLPHDHLDDLESFFYIFVHILFVCDAQGVSYPLPEMLSEWNKQNAGVAAGLKEALLARAFVPSEVEERWPIPCLDLFHDLRAFISSLVRQKQELNYSKPVAREEKVKELAANVDQHYTHVLQLLDRAIEALIQAETETPAATNIDQPAVVRPTNTHPPFPDSHSAPTAPQGGPDSQLKIGTGEEVEEAGEEVYRDDPPAVPGSCYVDQQKMEIQSAFNTHKRMRVEIREE